MSNQKKTLGGSFIDNVRGETDNESVVAELDLSLTESGQLVANVVASLVENGEIFDDVGRKRFKSLMNSKLDQRPSVTVIGNQNPSTSAESQVDDESSSHHFVSQERLYMTDDADSTFIINEEDDVEASKTDSGPSFTSPTVEATSLETSENRLRSRQILLDKIRSNEDLWKQYYSTLNLEAIEEKESKSCQLRYAVAKKTLQMGDFISFIRGRPIPENRVQKILKKYPAFVIDIGHHHKNRFIDTRDYPNWPGNLIKTDKLNANCDVWELLINENYQYCYYATKEIPVGSRFFCLR